VGECWRPLSKCKEWMKKEEDCLKSLLGRITERMRLINFMKSRFSLNQS
jgi:hypothetical protein